MNEISENVYISKLSGIVNKCNNTYHRTIKMKRIDFKTSSYIDFKVESNVKNLKFNVGNYQKIPKNTKILKHFCNMLRRKRFCD